MKTNRVGGFLVGFVAAAVFAGANVQAEVRVWTDVQNRPLSAEFAGLTGNVLSLKLANGTVVQVPMERLKESDQQLARQLAAMPAPAPSATLPTPQNW